MESEDPDGELKAHKQFRQALAELRARFAGTLESVESQPPTVAEVASLAGLGADLGRLADAYLDQLNTFADRKRRIEEEASVKRVMAEKRSTSPRDEVQIQKLSQELTTGLRLERVDAAIKELLDFLDDTDFFTENASTGRRRRLRTLQNAIEKALQKQK